MALKQQIAEHDEVSLRISKLPDSTRGIVQACRLRVSFWHFSTWQADQQAQLPERFLKLTLEQQMAEDDEANL